MSTEEISYSSDDSDASCLDEISPEINYFEVLENMEDKFYQDAIEGFEVVIDQEANLFSKGLIKQRKW